MPCYSADMSGQSSETIAQSLARLIARPVEPGARIRASRHVLDWVGCAVAGLASDAGRAMAALAAREGEGPALALGAGRRPARAAAFANGSYGNVLEMDDVHRAALLHPGPVVIPAALALAEAIGASAEALLDAIVRGYEAVIRVGAAVGPAHYAFFHNTSTCGPFGAAAAGASALGLDPARAAQALALAGSATGGFWQTRHEPNMGKQLHAARAAESGVAAALLAADGFTGPLSILEGPQGLFAATCGNADPHAILTEPGCKWSIFATSFKPWPACRHAHAAIDAALEIRPRLAGRAIRAGRVTTYRDAILFCDKPEPRTVLEAKFSLQHAVAVVLERGEPRLEDFEPAAIADARLSALRERVTADAGEPYAARYPARFGARLEVTADDGETLAADVPDALGDPENPLDESRLIAKALGLMQTGGLPPALADRLVDAALSLADGGAVASLTRLLEDAKP